MHIPRVHGGRGGWLRAIASLLLAWLSIGAVGAEISGHIDLTSDGKSLRPEEAQDAVVYFRPKQPPKIKPAAKPYVMGTRHKQFVPRVLPIAVGSQVQFPNQDPILHNAFSTSKDNPFDVGLYGEGEGQTLAFTHVGYVRVYCNVHHSMIGHILVLDTPYFAQPDANGDFRLPGVPQVPGDLVIWHERATPWLRELTPEAKTSERVQLDLSQRRVPQHMNKFGKPYGRTSDGGY